MTNLIKPQAYILNDCLFTQVGPRDILIQDELFVTYLKTIQGKVVVLANANCDVVYSHIEAGNLTQTYIRSTNS